MQGARRAGRTWRLRWQPTSMKKSDSTAQMRLHTSLQPATSAVCWISAEPPVPHYMATCREQQFQAGPGFHPLALPQLHGCWKPSGAVFCTEPRGARARMCLRAAHVRSQGAPLSTTRLILPMLKCAISTILVRLNTRGLCTGLSSSAAMLLMVRTNCTMASLHAAKNSTAPRSVAPLLLPNSGCCCCCCL
jgi:hypothetical protein